MKFDTSVSLKPRRIMKLGDFKGVDFSSSPYDVKTTRASNMKNLINEYGVNRKRRGWREVQSFGRGMSINGIFSYTHKDHKVILVHAGNKIFLLDSLWTGKPLDITGELVLEDKRSEAYYNEGALYIVGCGDYLVYGQTKAGDYKLRSVYGDELTYVPTTTISIDAEGEADPVRTVLEKVNVLTPRRKNLLLGKSIGEGESTTWKTDATSFDKDSDVVLTLELKDGNGNVYDKEIRNGGNDKRELYCDGELVGSVNYKAGSITLNIDTTPPVSNKSNITAEFSETYEGYEQLLKKCSFGVLFGTSGETDRLFLAGNPSFPNVDFYSEPRNFTYFVTENSCTVGSDAAAIKGYLRLADSTLIIFKEAYMNEPGIYYRTGYTETEYDEMGNASGIAGIFPSVAGALGENLASRHALANFGGDPLMISKNGVFGVVIGENARTTERYTRERSRPINEHLKRKALENASGFVYQNKYYLAVDGVCYVADRRFTYRGSDALDGAYNYEWWYWDNIPARIFAELDGQLLFGTDDGKIAVFDNEYSDRTYIFSGNGGVTVSDGNLTVEKEMQIEKTDRITLRSEAYTLYADKVEKSGDRLGIGENFEKKIYNGLELYADNVGKSGLNPGVKYVICDVDFATMEYSLKDETGKKVEVLEGGFNLHKRIDGKELYIAELSVDETKGFRVALREYENSEEAMLLSNYDGEGVTNTKITVTKRKNVVAEWYTPILDMGTNGSAKTLLSVTVATEPEINGNISFGYETRTATKLIGARGINSFSIGEMAFDNFSFETGFASSYTKKLNVRNFNYIIFRFISDSDTDCAVNNISLVYKINKTNKGVR